MDIILIPGYWLNASSWDAVVPALEKGGHRVQALTLPGLESVDTDRSAITLRDQIDHVIAAVDATEGPVVLVGHSAGGGVAAAAGDARPGQVARGVYVGSEPRGTDEGGSPFKAEGSDVPLPDWDFFDDEMVADLDADLRATIAARGVPVPVHAANDPLVLTDERRYDVPITMVCCEFPKSQYDEWLADSDGGVAELAKVRDITWVEIGGGHWPQFSQPEALARAILDAVG